MLLYRSLTIGLLGASFMLLASESPVPPATSVPTVISRGTSTVRPRVATDGATLIDVSARVPGETIASLIRLERDEHVIAVDDRPVDGDLAAGAAISRPRSGGYIDVMVSDGSRERRVLLLLH